MAHCKNLAKRLNSGRALRKTVAPTIVACLFLMASAGTAHAEWDPGAFVELLQSAETSFFDADYDSALQKYLELDTSLNGAIANNEIPEAQLADAKVALSTIKYQLALSYLRTGNCDKAASSFTSLLDAQNVESVVRVKLDVRFAESQLCIATTSKEKSKRLSAVNQAWGRLSALDDDRVAVLGDEGAPLRADITKQTEALAATVDGDCGSTRAVSHLTSASFVTVSESVANSLSSGVKQCDEAEASPGALNAYGPYATMGAGGLLIALFLVNEAAVSSDSDAFEDARRGCVGGAANNCPRALTLADDIESGQVVSAVLLGLGGALVGGGAYWYWQTRDSDSAASASSADGWKLGVGADQVSIGYRLSWGR